MVYVESSLFSVNPKSATRNATKYVGILTEVSKVSMIIPVSGMVSFAIKSMLDLATMSSECPRLTLNWAFFSGSSKHGKDFLAPVVSNWVTANHFVASSTKIKRREIRLREIVPKPNFRTYPLRRNNYCDKTHPNRRSKRQ